MEMNQWKTTIPKQSENQYGLPKLYLCQILALDVTYGYRYTYNIGFITKENKWNLDGKSEFINVVRYMDIDCSETTNQLLKDIERVDIK